MTNLRPLFLPVLSVLIVAGLDAGSEDSPHPRVLANSKDRDEILQKIEGSSWMQSSLERMMAEVDPYADRHVEDPEWLLSRMLMLHS